MWWQQVLSYGKKHTEKKNKWTHPEAKSELNKNMNLNSSCILFKICMKKSKALEGIVFFLSEIHSLAVTNQAHRKAHIQCCGELLCHQNDHSLILWGCSVTFEGWIVLEYYAQAVSFWDLENLNACCLTCIHILMFAKKTFYSL